MISISQKPQKNKQIHDCQTLVVLLKKGVIFSVVTNNNGVVTVLVLQLLRKTYTKNASYRDQI